MLAAFALAAIAIPGEAQRRGKAVVSAQLSTGVARPGEQVVMNIVVENARTVRIDEVPTVDGLVIGVPEGPFTSRYTQIVNGRISERLETSFRGAIRGTEEGQFEIPPFVLTIDGKTVRTRPVTLKILRDIKGENVGFFAITPSSNKVVEGQPFALELRFGWDPSTRSDYADLSLPWWDALPGTLNLETDELAEASGSVRINGTVTVPVERVPPSRGDEMVEFRLMRSFLPTRSGKLDFPTSFLEFGRSSKRSLFGTQRKLANYFVRADAFELEVVPLPREGQPYEYSGAVGTLRVRANADTREVLVGDSIKLTVDWTGSGNLEFFEAPDLALLDTFRGFRVYGKTEEKSFGRRRVIYDLAPIDSDVDAIPPVPLSVYDLESESYTTLETDPIPIRVRALERAIVLGDEGEGEERMARDIADIDARGLAAGTEDMNEGSGALSNRALFSGSAMVFAAWLLLRAKVRKRYGDPSGPLERRRRRARRELTRRLRAAADPRATLLAFTSYLSARTRETDESWIGRDIADWSRAREGVPSDELAAMFERLERAVYGGGEGVSSGEVLALADRLGRAGL